MWFSGVASKVSAPDHVPYFESRMCALTTVCKYGHTSWSELFLFRASGGSCRSVPGMTSSRRATVHELSAVAAALLTLALTTPLWAPIPGMTVAILGNFLELGLLTGVGNGLLDAAEDLVAAASRTVTDNDRLRSAVAVAGAALVVDVIAREARIRLG